MGDKSILSSYLTIINEGLFPKQFNIAAYNFPYK